MDKNKLGLDWTDDPFIKGIPQDVLPKGTVQSGAKKKTGIRVGEVLAGAMLSRVKSILAGKEKIPREETRVKKGPSPLPGNEYDESYARGALKVMHEVAGVLSKKEVNPQEREKEITGCLFAKTTFPIIAELGMKIDDNRKGGLPQKSFMNLLQSPENVKKIFLWQIDRNGGDLVQTTAAWPESVLSFLCNNLERASEQPKKREEMIAVLREWLYSHIERD